MTKKYEILSHYSRVFKKAPVYRIRALRDIPFYGVRAGDLGGWVANKDNLSQRGDCWVGDEAIAAQESYVCNDALLRNTAQAFGKVLLLNSVQVRDNARAFGSAALAGHAKLLDNSHICDKGYLMGYAVLRDTSSVRGNARVLGDAVLRGDAFVGGTAIIHGNAEVRQGARVHRPEDVLVFTGVGSTQTGTLTVYRSTTGINVTRGCFKGTLKKFREAVDAYHRDSEYAAHYHALANVIDHWFTRVHPLNKEKK